jgi:crotonobetainyl-CoA:carnitine CoA-transferase CaiB-like acyl-CoA transferase
MFKPLSGIRVVDLTQVLAGPYATYQLALMGAEVIKIEKPGMGDWTREGGSVPELAARKMGIGYLTQNSDKKSVTLDLKTGQGMDLLKQLIKTADVFVENFRPGTAAGLGLSFEDVKAVNPKIVYCSISAYGQDGPIGHRPAYDHVVQGMCGIMNTTGVPGGGPTKVGAPYVDYATGMNAALAIMAALREAEQTGKAVRADVAMLDSALLLMATLLTNNMMTGWQPTQTGNEAWSGSPSSGAFETQDGMLMLAANNDPQFVKMCIAFGRQDILEDPRWSTPEERKKNAGELRVELVALMKTKTADEWEQLLDTAKVPAARVRNIDEVLREGQIQARGLMAEVDLPGYDGEVHLPALGFKINGEMQAPTSPPPTLGGDTDEVLGELGLDAAKIEELRGAGVI